jgi:hypothetical protein
MGEGDREKASTFLKEAIAAKVQIDYDKVYSVVEERMGLGRAAGKDRNYAVRQARQRSNEPFVRVMETSKGVWFEVKTNFALQYLEKSCERNFNFDLSTHRVFVLSRFALANVRDLKRITGYAIYDRMTGEAMTSLNKKTSEKLPDNLTRRLEVYIRKAKNPLTESKDRIILEELEVEELQEVWSDDQNGEYIQINSNDEVWYVSGGVGKEMIPTGNSDDEPWTSIRVWMDEEGWYPNIWMVNDHGNVSLYSSDGEYLGGLV